MNININTAYTVVWQNVNYVDWHTKRIYFTSGDFLKLSDEEAEALRESVSTEGQGGQYGGTDTS